MSSNNDALDGHPVYERIRGLGKGQFGNVQLCRRKTDGKEVAIKLLALDAYFSSDNVQKEILNHRMLIHNHIVEFYEVFVYKNNLCIVMEYCNGGSLYDYLLRKGPLPEFEGRYFFQQLVTALLHCHLVAHVVNRDLKLENLLLRCGRSEQSFPLLKVCDFGYSKHLGSDSAPITKVGTAAYVAPEVIHNSESRTMYDGTKADIWSAGVVLFVLLCGRYPFTGGTVDHNVAVSMVANLTQAAVDAVILQQTHLSDPCKQFLRKLLSVDPNQRISLDHILQDPWFKHMCPDISKLSHTTPRSAQGPEEIRAIVQQAKQIADSYRQHMTDDFDLQDYHYSDDERGMDDAG